MFISGLGMRNSTGSPLFSDLSRVVRFRPLVKGNEDPGYEGARLSARPLSAVFFLASLWWVFTQLAPVRPGIQNWAIHHNGGKNAWWLMSDDHARCWFNFIKVRKSVRIPCSCLVKLYKTASLLWVSWKHRTWKRRPQISKTHSSKTLKTLLYCLCTSWESSLFYEINWKTKI